MTTGGVGPTAGRWRSWPAASRVPGAQAPLPGLPALPGHWHRPLGAQHALTLALDPPPPCTAHFGKTQQKSSAGWSSRAPGETERFFLSKRALREYTENAFTQTPYFLREGALYTTAANCKARVHERAAPGAPCPQGSAAQRQAPHSGVPATSQKCPLSGVEGPRGGHTYTVHLRPVHLFTSTLHLKGEREKSYMVTSRKHQQWAERQAHSRRSCHAALVSVTLFGIR